MKWICVMITLAACGEQDLTVRGPVRTYAVDGFTLPTTLDEARAMGCDLTDSGAVQNQLGSNIARETQDGNITPYVAELIGSGMLASRVTLQTEDLQSGAAAVRYIGHEGAPSVRVVGTLDDGAFSASPRYRGAAVVRLPLFIDADVSQLQLNTVSITLDPDGADGFNAHICGGVPEAEARADGARAIAQMTRNNPDENPSLIALFDTNHNGEVTTDEVLASGLFTAVISADVKIGGQPLVSLGFRAHLTPCPDGVCPEPAPPVMRCYDRVLDGDEADVDCGGTTCLPCASGLACSAPADCASLACDGGTCGAATCTDGVRDGFESDVDCGWECSRCAVGQLCERAGDCITNMCGANGKCY